MMKLCILSVQNDKKSIIKKIIAPFSIKEQFVDKFDVTVIETAFTPREIIRFPKWLKKYILKKGKRFARSTGAEYVTLTCEFSDVIGVEFCKTIETEIRPSYMNSAIEYLSDNLSSSPKENNVLILDKEGRGLRVSAFSCLYDKIDRLMILTDNNKEAERFEEGLMDGYGLCPEIWSGNARENEFSYVIDMDKCRVRTGGKNYTEKMEIGLIIKGYEVNVMRLTEDYPEVVESLSFIRWI